ncbi:30S ribosomal protein S9 [bacterium]|nr:30S ribosomal protein S9 [bacterium]NUN46125.1 30S ribosomal protein S9 [bacterium]HMV26719.1 30S ribosomal protein S9 [bacterium]HMW32251.1 30S ribosomal protein S9 [bacterium]HMW35389.1 30S ribosomal protein S9 [bacterium]
MSAPLAAVGRRKTATARVRLVPGNGKVTINHRDIKDYFPRGSHQIHVTEPLTVVEAGSKYDVIALTRGGGPSGQAGAIRLGIARALVKIDEEMKKALKPIGAMSRDPRMKERRKYGLAKARKRYQFSKR